MTIYARKTDTNQAEIVRALRQVGARVYPTHHVGRGFPDLVASFRGQVFLLEIKSASGKLTPAEAEFIRDFEAVHVVRSVDEALAAIGAVVAG